MNGAGSQGVRISEGPLYYVYRCFLEVNVVEVAHDMQLQVARYIKQDLKLLNSFDTWHGMDFG